MHVIEDARGNGDIVIGDDAQAHKFLPNVICAMELTRTHSSSDGWNEPM